MNKSLVIPIAIITCLVLAGLAYWYFFFYGAGKPTVALTSPGQQSVSGFAPLNSNSTNRTGSSTPSSLSNTPVSIQPSTVRIATLRMISGTPVGGYSASTSASTTIVRWIDRGRGNVYELSLASETVATLSNTILPRMYESVWNKNLTAFVGSIFSSKIDTPTTLYAQLKAQDPSAAASNKNSVGTTPFQLKGNNLQDNIVAFAASPKGDKLFTLVNENGAGVGYISNFDGSSMARLFSTPLIQVNVEWTETNTIAITTKGSAGQPGYLYFVNTKTGIWKKILGPIAGLSTRTSHDAHYVLASSANNDQNVDTAIYTVSSGSFSSAVFRTLADKCAWGNLNMNSVYCAVPSQPVSGTYPDDWYTGTLSTIDKIWKLNAGTGEINLVSTIVDKSDRVIDAFNLKLDPQDGYLFFMNKNDLSFWSYDLSASH